MTGQTGPQGPRWYTLPSEVDVPVEEIVVGPYSEELGVRIKIDGFTKEAVVPAGAVDREKKVVRGTIIGEAQEGNVILVVLPPSSMGRTILEMKREILERLVA